MRYPVSRNKSSAERLIYEITSHGHSDLHRQALEGHLPAVHMRCTSSRSMASLFSSSSSSSPSSLQMRLLRSPKRSSLSVVVAFSLELLLRIV